MKIDRGTLQSSIREFAEGGSGLVIGPPGVGKTYLLRQLSEELISEGRPCLYLPVDKVDMRSADALSEDLGLNTSLVHYLRNQELGGSAAGMLIVDAFDAARSEDTRTTCLQLIRRVRAELSDEWNVLVSSRTFDAEKSDELAGLFAEHPDEQVHTAGCALEDSCRAFVVPRLEDAEVRTALQSDARLAGIYEDAQDDFRQVLRTPFNIWLLEGLLGRSQRRPTGLSSVASEIGLLELYFSKRIAGGELGESRSRLLREIVEAMVSQRALSVSRAQVSNPKHERALRSLMSSEVLVSASTVTRRVAFSHNMLFDFAVAFFLIDADADSVAEFIAGDPSRQLFLRSAMDYHFTRLWLASSSGFWEAALGVMSDGGAGTRLLTRLVPIAVAAREVTDVHQLQPLFDLQEKAPKLAGTAIRQMMEARRAFGFGRDTLWVQILSVATKHLHREFAWNAATLTSEILGRSDESGEKSIAIECGRVARGLLSWVWGKRESDDRAWYNHMGSRVVTPAVVRTFGTAPDESRTLLEPILDAIGDESFPIDYVYRLADGLPHIWKHDTEFASRIFLAVFGHWETSEKVTTMGSPVLQLLSTRKQDFQMCQYVLVKHFRDFLRDHNREAIHAAILSVDTIILAEHVFRYDKSAELHSLSEDFAFRGGVAHYVPDGSFIWDDRIGEHEALGMADDVFKHVVELGSSSAHEKEMEWFLDELRESAWSAFFWRRLLAVGAQVPAPVALKLYDLCLAEPILVHGETLREVGSFIESVYAHLSKARRSQLEKKLMSLPQLADDEGSRKHFEYRRNRLIARIPSNLLETDSAIDLRRELEAASALPGNEPLSSMTSTCKPYTRDDWLEEQGAAAGDERNRTIVELSETVRQYSGEWQNKIPSSDSISETADDAHRLHGELLASKDADAAVLEAGWADLGSYASAVARGLDSAEDDEFGFCREVLLASSTHESPRLDPEGDVSFDFPHWSSAPRTEAAQGLPWLAALQAEPEVLSAIEILSKDPVPSVRFLTAMEMFRLCYSATDTFWRIALDRARNEGNKAILDGLCHSIGRAAGTSEDRAVEVLKVVSGKATESGDTELLTSVVSLLMHFTCSRSNKWAEAQISRLLDEPVRYSESLKRVTSEALAYVKPQRLTETENRRSVSEALKWLHRAVAAAAHGIAEVRDRNEGEWSEEETDRLRSIYATIDSVVSRSYFHVKPREDASLEMDAKCTYHSMMAPILDEVLEFTSDPQNGVLFAPTAHYLMQYLREVLSCDPAGVLSMAARTAASAEAYGYGFDSIALKEVVELVQLVLADHRDVARGGQPLTDLLDLLDVFARTGAPEALQVVWRLEEVYR